MIITGELSNADLGADVLTEGYAIASQCLSDSEVDELVAWSRKFEGHRMTRSGATFAIRYLLENRIVQNLAREPSVRDLAAKLVGPECIAVGATLFDKVAEANWIVPFHQDVTAAVKERREVAGYGPWSVKGGLLNVQLPGKVLENMVTIRIHLDDCLPDDGPLRVLPGSHLEGRLDAGQISRAKSSVPEHVCVVRKGDVLVIRPLLLHASSASTSGRPRRVLQIEYAGSDLPHGLEWRFAVR